MDDIFEPFGHSVGKVDYSKSYTYIGYLYWLREQDIIIYYTRSINIFTVTN